jgi:hypothetical protein
VAHREPYPLQAQIAGGEKKAKKDSKRISQALTQSEGFDGQQG